jgi:HSP20 family protein
MFEKLIPWKKRHGQLTARHGEPTRQNEADDYPLIHLRQQFDSMMNRLFDESWFGTRGNDQWLAPWDQTLNKWNWDLGWEDKGDQYVFRAELPGFEPDDFDVKVTGNLMKVHAEHKSQQIGGKNGSGYQYGSYSRTCTLPHGVDETRIDARYHSGVLEVHLPKTEDAASKRIEVKSA